MTAQRDIRVADRLIVVMGDSFASGEGNPHTPIVYGSDRIIAQPTWDDRKCHRSMYAGGARAARILEQEDPHSSVTYLSRGLLGGDDRLGRHGSVRRPREGRRDARPRRSNR